MGPLKCFFTIKKGSAAGLRSCSLSSVTCLTCLLLSLTTEILKSSTTVLRKTSAALFWGPSSAAKQMVRSPDGGHVPAECQSNAHVGLQCDKKGNGMPVPSQTRGVVQRPVKPHAPALHVLRMPLLPKYILLQNCTVYILMGVCVYMVSPRNLRPGRLRQAAHTYICEIPLAALECGGGDNYHCHLGRRMPSDKAV